MNQPIPAEHVRVIDRACLHLDGHDVPAPHPDLDITDATVTVEHWDGTVHAGLGAVVHVHAGVTYTATDGAVVYAHPGALTGDLAPDLLERADATIVAVA